MRVRRIAGLQRRSDDIQSLRRLVPHSPRVDSHIAAGASPACPRPCALPCCAVVCSSLCAGYPTIRTDAVALSPWPPFSLVLFLVLLCPAWLPATPQFINFCLFAVEAKVHFLPSLGDSGYYILIGWMVWVGLMGGGIYSNCM